jgi:16S rRNA (cytosine967-C5)-methyltransferase
VAGDARAAALKALTLRRRSNVRLDEALAAAADGLSGRDFALASRLCYGVTQNYRLIDLELDKHIGKTQPQVLDILWLSVYQLWYLDRVPRRALTDEAVRLCKKTAPHASGMVNAVLRKIADSPPHTDDLAVRYSLPDWFCAKMAAVLPESEIEAFFESCNAVPHIYTQSVCGGRIEQAVVAPGRELEEFLKSGKGVVADPAARMAVEALCLKPGMSLWDACAAPGGKTLMSAFVMQNRGYILATDKNADKLALIAGSLERCGIDIVTVKQADAAEYSPGETFDAVLCDVPCSGFGVLRRKPDIRYRTETAHFPAAQLAILQNASKAVRQGGVLVYSTCTLFAEENEDVIAEFVKGGFKVEAMETLWPHRGDTDGFFICRMRK